MAANLSASAVASPATGCVSREAPQQPPTVGEFVPGTAFVAALTNAMTLLASPFMGLS